jgi:nitric oxide reductase large subunit
MKDEKNDWNEKDAFLEQRAKAILKVLDDIRQEFGEMSEFVTMKQGLLQAFGKVSDMRERLFNPLPKPEKEPEPIE